MSFPIAMMVLFIGFLASVLAFGKLMAFLGVRKFIEEDEKPKIKPHYK